jgi:bacillithiol system protein YtxJ
VSTIIPLQDKALPENCLVFKHSTTCPVSATAGHEVRGLDTGLPIYWINVREQRELSNWVAATYGVMHESPQLILIRGGKAEKSWSHYEVNRTTVNLSPRGS